MVTINFSDDESDEIQISLNKDFTSHNNSKPEIGSITRNTASADDYTQHELRDHIYSIPDTYIGSDEKNPRDDRVLNLSDPSKPRFEVKTVTLPEGVERLFLEILSNAGDNVQRSREHKVDIGKIEVSMDYKTISIKNGGVPIPIQINKSTGKWAPDMIMGNLLTSSNYNEERTGAGRNGYGAKLVNIFGKKFWVIVGDPFNKKKYTQMWSENMTIRGEPIIEDGYTGESYVHIIYEMDFERFKYNQYPDEAFEIFARHSADIAFTCKVPVSFNGIALNAQNVYEYSKWMYPDQKNIIVHYEWPNGIELKNRRLGQSLVGVATDTNAMPLVELAVIDTPDEGALLAYVNGIPTKEGGVHVEKAYRVVGDSILSVINNSKSSKKDSKSRASKLDIGSIKRHVTIVMSCRLMNPKFTSQQKTKLTGPNPQIKLDEDKLKPMKKWDLINRLYAELEAKQFRALKKTDGTKKKHVQLEKYEGANFSGSNKSMDCTLCVTEGDSAMAYAGHMISHVPGGRDYFGMYPLKGKPLNVMAATPLKIANNKEITELKEVLGLREGVDYMIESNFKTLRYGHLLIISDADDDGKHICGLVLNIFYCRYPSLLQRGFLKLLRTPIIRVSKGSTFLKFYTRSEYDTWRDQTTDVDKWRHKYLKGLGTSSKADIKEDQKTPMMVAFVYDDTCPHFFTLAFNPNKIFTDDRKKWIAQYQVYLNIETIKMLPISIYLNHELIEFAVTNVGRSIPGIDGFKISQRKIIWGSMKKWGSKVGAPSSESMNTLRLVSNIGESTNYHYGPNSLVGAINHMAFDFAGSNNMPPFFSDGMFGTRIKNGHDASAPRYTATKPEWWWPYLFPKEDHNTKSPRPYMIMREEEGEIWEPKFMLPTLPICLINGARGVGTGYSTYIPNHDPLDLCAWIRSRLTNTSLPVLKPWYKGFNGSIILNGEQIENKVSMPIDGEDSDDEDGDVEIQVEDIIADHDIVDSFGNLDGDQDSDNSDPNEDPLGNDDIEVEIEVIDKKTKKVGSSMLSQGSFHVSADGIHVTELPLERSIHDYETWLKHMLSEKFINDYDNKCGSKGDGDVNNIHFIIKGMKNPTHKKLRLEKRFGLTNMVLLDHNDRPRKFKDTQELFEIWFQWRFPFYVARKDFTVQNLTDQISVKNDKIRFIKAVILGTERGFILGESIIVMKQKKNDIYTQMDHMQIPRDLLKLTNLSNCTEDEIKKLEQEIAQLTKEREEILQTRVEDMWIRDIDKFEKEYRRVNKLGGVMGNITISLDDADSDSIKINLED